MVKYEDYYEILGVSRTANDAEIKKAYRKLAREFHPDRNQKNKAEAEAKFKKINEAYEILSNSEKRAQYDRLGKIPHGSEFKPPPGFDFNFSGQPGNASFSDIFDLFFNASGGTQPRGNAGFANPFGDFAFQQNVAVKGDDVSATLGLTVEEAFKGTTKKINLANATFEVSIPAGVNKGSKIRVTGKGRPSMYGGPNGDLFLVVHIIKNSNLSINGDNVESQLHISITDAVFGNHKQVQTLDGMIDLTIPAGIQSGQKLRLSGKGWHKKAGGRGDHFVQILVKIPKNLSEQEKLLFEQLRNLEKQREGN